MKIWHAIVIAAAVVAFVPWRPARLSALLVLIFFGI